MNTQLLQIDLIDESVDMTVAGMRDYIGSVRIPLRKLMITGSIADTFAVVDENRRKTGELNVKITMHSVDDLSGMTIEESMRLKRATQTEKETINKIVSLFAQSSPDGLDLVLDMLFTLDNT